MIDQHYKDIDNYKTEQNVLEPRLRYENTIERVRSTFEKSQEITLKRLRHNEMYNNSCLK